MTHLLQSQLLPETSAEILARFSIAGPLAVRAVLDDLVRERPLISLYSSDDFDEFVVSQLLGWDDHGVRLDFTTDQGRQRALTTARRIIVVAFLDRIKIQFDAVDASIRTVDGRRELHCAVPRVVYRIQRRDAYRVRPPASQPAQCVVRGQNGVERAYRVADVSAGGVGLLLPPLEQAPLRGDLWRHCRLEIPGYPPIPCDLAVRVVAEGLRDAAAGHRIGCEFVHATPEAQRAVQLYVMDIERGRPPAPHA